MQTNAMKRALERGETQVGVWINMIRNPAILRLMKSAGLDFARFDMEHASPSMETLSNMALLARAMDFTLTVRPPQGNREWITRILDAHGVRPRVRVEAGTMLAAMALVEAGAGAFVVDAFTLGAVRDAHVVIRPFHPEVIVEVGALYSSSQPLTILASRFLDYCRAFQQETETT